MFVIILEVYKRFYFMDIKKINGYNNKLSFGIKCSPHLIQTAHNSYNYSNVPNKRNLIWSFNNKVEEYSSFGYEDYTLDYERKMTNGNWQHYLMAAKDGNPNKKFVVIKRTTLSKIINRFLNMTENDFRNTMRQKINR